jgi:hypothetical protein
MYEKYVKLMRDKYKGGDENTSNIIPKSQPELPYLGEVSGLRMNGVMTKINELEGTNGVLPDLKGEIPLAKKTIPQSEQELSYLKDDVKNEKKDNKTILDYIIPKKGEDEKVYNKEQTLSEIGQENHNKVVYRTSLGVIVLQLGTMLYWLIKS